MKKLSFNMAFGGILSALCIVLMFAVGLLPIFVYVFPMICGYIMYAVYYECGLKYAISAYFCVSILSLLLGPDKEAGLLYFALFGYYPIAKIHIDRIKPKLIKLIIKLAIFNAAVISVYWILIYLFKVVSITDFVGEGGTYLIWAFLGVSNIVFLMYDFALSRIAILYEYRIRKLLFKRK